MSAGIKETALPELPAFAISRLRMATDGEGITTLVGCAGCPLRCRYCINPHAWRPETPVRRYGVRALVDLLRQDDLYFAATGGGVTFGGGEPLLHAPFIAALARECPSHWKICVESALNVPESAVRMLWDAVSQWIVDAKDLNPAIYRAYTGQDAMPALRNLHLLATHCPDRVQIRLPHIPGYNHPEDVGASEQMLRTMGFLRIERLTYRLPAQKHGTEE